MSDVEPVTGDEVLWPDQYVADLRTAGLTVVEGRQWDERGGSLAAATAVRVEYLDRPDVAATVDSLQDRIVHAYVRRDGSVWLLGAADGDGAVVVVLPAVQKGRGKATEVQKDATDVLLAHFAYVGTAETRDVTDAGEFPDPENTPSGDGTDGGEA